jgi:hypothetical protein
MVAMKIVLDELDKKIMYHTSQGICSYNELAKLQCGTQHDLLKNRQAGKHACYEQEDYDHSELHKAQSFSLMYWDKHRV